MDGSELEKLNEIHDDVRQTRTRVEVIDERTSALDARIETVQSQVGGNATDINKLQSRVSRNSTILGGFATGATVVLLWISDKVSRIL